MIPTITIEKRWDENERVTEYGNRTVPPAGVAGSSSSTGKPSTVRPRLARTRNVRDNSITRFSEGEFFTMTLALNTIFTLTPTRQMAHAVCDLGSVVVLTNNSTCFIVAETSDDNPAEGRLVGIFEYGRSLPDAYRGALTLMLERAIEWTDDLGMRFQAIDDACPGCGSTPGMGRTKGCTHPDGCGAFLSPDFDTRDREGA